MTEFIQVVAIYALALSCFINAVIAFSMTKEVIKDFIKYYK